MQDLWFPFQVTEYNPSRTSKRKLAPRDVLSLEGRGDRMRSAAFAELQAVKAFNWAADFFTDASDDLRATWRALAIEEQRHYDLIINRMRELDIDPAGRPVTIRLFESLQNTTSAEQFARYIAGSEERGRQSGLQFINEISEIDPETAAIFVQICEDESNHIAIVDRAFPKPEAIC